ncbi:hypothetical protein BJX76DRAFT_59308 [Aspergillus varians]
MVHPSGERLPPQAADPPCRQPLSCGSLYEVVFPAFQLIHTIRPLFPFSTIKCNLLCYCLHAEQLFFYSPSSTLERLSASKCSLSIIYCFGQVLLSLLLVKTESGSQALARSFLKKILQRIMQISFLAHTHPICDCKSSKHDLLPDDNLSLVTCCSLRVCHVTGFSVLGY